MTVSVVAPDLIASHGLTADEYDRIVAIIGREPNLVELGMFGAMWSEHCSYKSSRVHLAGLPTEGPRILQGPGRTRAFSTSGMVWRWSLRWKVTTTHLSLSRIRGLPQA